MTTELKIMSRAINAKRKQPSFVKFSSARTKRINGNGGTGKNLISLDAKRKKVNESRNATNTLKTRREEIRNLISEAYDSEYKKVDWNGYGAKPLDKQSIDFANQFLESLAKEIALPSVEPNPNGYLGLYWSKGDYQLLLDISPEGIISYAFKSRNGLAYTGRPSFFSAIPKRLNTLLADYFKK